MIAREINDPRLMPAADQGRIPMKAISFLSLRRFRSQVAFFTIPQIDPMDETFLAFGIEDIVIGKIEDDIKPVSTFQRQPIGISNPFLARDLAGADETFVVLQPARDA